MRALLILSLPLYSPLFSVRERLKLTGCHGYGHRKGREWMGSGRRGICADQNRCWFILEACWVASTLHIPVCLTMAVKAGVARPSSGDRWSLLE